MTSTRFREALFCHAHLVAAGLAFVGCVAVHHVFPNADIIRYDRLAENLLHGVYSSCTAPPYLPEFERTPGYPVFLAAVRFVAGAGLYKAIVAQAAVHAGAIVALYWLALAIVRQRTIASLAAIFWAFEPFALYYVLSPFSEYLSTALQLAALTGFVLWLRSGSRWAMAGAIVAQAYAAYTRPNLMALPVFLLALSFVVKRTRIRTIRKGLGVLIAGLLLALVPWTIRNYQAFGKPIVGAHQYLSANLCESAVQFRLSSRQMEQYCLEAVAGEWLNECDWHKNLEADAVFRERAIAAVKEHPFQTIAFAFVRPVRVWVSTRIMYNKALFVLEPLMCLYTFAAFPLFVAGGWLLWRRTELGFLATGACLFVSSIHLIMMVSARYNMPARPYYVLSIAVSVYVLWRNRLALLRRDWAACDWSIDAGDAGNVPTSWRR
jgi:4-amino-4-deoxy-L-arabinose transferase-like glycosyltransferase